MLRVIFRYLLFVRCRPLNSAELRALPRRPFWTPHRWRKHMSGKRVYQELTQSAETDC